MDHLILQVFSYADMGASIREFVNLSIPVFMFDKNQDFVVMTMGEVGLAVSLAPLPLIMMFYLDCLCSASVLLTRSFSAQLLPMSFGPDRLPPPGAPGAMG
jgi:hypothetical protein